MGEMHRNLIGGEWRAGTRCGSNVIPSNTDDVIVAYAKATAGP